MKHIKLFEEFIEEYKNFFTGKSEKDATFFPKGTMAKSAEEIYKAGKNKKYAPGGLGSAIKWITYYLNRGGKGIDPEQRKELEKARDMLQKDNESGPYAEEANEKESPYDKETLLKYQKEYEAGKDIPFGVKSSLIAQGMIPREGGPNKGKKVKSDEYK